MDPAIRDYHFYRNIHDIFVIRLVVVILPTFIVNAWPTNIRGPKYSAMFSLV